MIDKVSASLCSQPPKEHFSLEEPSFNHGFVTPGLLLLAPMLCKVYCPTLQSILRQPRNQQ